MSVKRQKRQSKRRSKPEKAARDKAWRELSQKVRRHKPHCEICGSSQHLCCHHVLEKKQNPELWLEENDLVVLCSRCHFKVHHHYSFEFHAWLAQNKPEQFEFLRRWLDANR